MARSRRVGQGGAVVERRVHEASTITPSTLHVDARGCGRRRHGDPGDPGHPRRTERFVKKVILSAAIAGLVVLVLASAAVAAERTRARDRDRDRDQVATLLGLNHDQLMDLRHDGLSLAQIAEQQQADPQALIDALQSRWAERIEERLVNGALTDAEATQLRSQLETRARDMVYRTLPGGMQGGAVGAGPGHRAGPDAGAVPGSGAGTGAAAGAGQRGHGPGMGSGAGQAAGTGQAAGPGQGAGSGTCDGTGPHGPGQP
jgi:hypothetical protein